MTAARGMADIDQKAAAMTELARQALCQLGITVHQAGNSHPHEEDPADYQETPVLNFDVRLNVKTRWRGSDRAGQPLTRNAGHNFPDGSRRFAIIGPLALNENTPLTTGQFAQHELELVARTPEPGHGRDDLELLTWTEDFRRYFHQYGFSLPVPQRPGWERLIEYYDAANATTRRRAIERLVDYYNHPPVLADRIERLQRGMRSWMRRKSGTLITDLNAALPATATR